jgi:uncharacterized membrane protein
MVAALILAALDSTYLSWRYLALRLGLVTPGSSICSWTAHIDCDRVLLTPEANAFFIPNALLGSAFSIGCLFWWGFGNRLGVEYRFHLVRTLVFWLSVASMGTLWFFWLLFHLDWFCPLCPLNHVMIYIALACAVVLYRRMPRPVGPARLGPLAALVALCVGYFLLVQVLWYVAEVHEALKLP